MGVGLADAIWYKRFCNPVSSRVSCAGLQWVGLVRSCNSSVVHGTGSLPCGVIEQRKIQFSDEGWKNIIKGIPYGPFAGSNKAYHVFGRAVQALRTLFRGEVRFLAARESPLPSPVMSSQTPP